MVLAGRSSGTAVFGRILVYGILLLFAAYFLLPLFFMVATSLKSLEELRQGTFLSLPSHVTFWAWWEAWVDGCEGVQCGGALGGHFINSLEFTIPAVLISTALGALNGYALTKVRFPGANIVFGMLLFGCFIPFQSILLPMAFTLGKLGLASTITGLILTHVVYGLCFTTLFFRNFYVTVPDELVHAATIDGAGFFSTFWRIMVPISLPIITVTLIWQFTQIWNDFLFGASFTRGNAQPITVALNNLVNTSEGVKRYNVDMAAAMIAAAPTLIVYVLAGKYFIRGLTAGAVKG
ncbi:MAG TPA: carbohydrate ABC transporter permease [Dongiaceae bacterium]|jgi:glucose/mannose transport system permease protein|nr:carbohydrate ABC transporter permease [Dongiaceae bacterium]